MVGDHLVEVHQHEDRPQLLLLITHLHLRKLVVADHLDVGLLQDRPVGVLLKVLLLIMLMHEDHLDAVHLQDLLDGVLLQALLVKMPMHEDHLDVVHLQVLPVVVHLPDLLVEVLPQALLVKILMHEDRLDVVHLQVLLVAVLLQVPQDVVHLQAHQMLVDVDLLVVARLQVPPEPHLVEEEVLLHHLQEVVHLLRLGEVARLQVEVVLVLVEAAQVLQLQKDHNPQNL